MEWKIPGMEDEALTSRSLGLLYQTAADDAVYSLVGQKMTAHTISHPPSNEDESCRKGMTL